MINAKEDATPLTNPGECLARILKGKTKKIQRKERRSEIMTGLFSGKVEISRAEYMTLVKESERNDVIRRLVKKNNYVSVEDLKTILCVEDEEVPKEVITFEELLGEKEGEE